jgi:hypothetical protein
MRALGPERAKQFPRLGFQAIEGLRIENAGSTRASARPGVRSFLWMRPASRLDIATATWRTEAIHANGP